MNTAESMAGKIRSLRPLSTSAVRLLDLLRNENATIADLLLLVSDDVALSTNLLHIANTAYYRGSDPVSSLHRAVVRLGRQGVYKAALGVSMRGSLPPILPGYQVSSEAFMRHSVAVAVLAERLARQTPGADPDEVFTAGLLHDVGKLVVGQFLAEKQEEMSARIATGAESVEEIELEVLSLDHSEVGAEIAARWRLPDATRVAARWHHNPQSAPTAGERHLAALVHHADAVAHLMGYSTGVGELLHRHSADAAPEISNDQAEFLMSSSLDAIVEFADAINGARL
jgi:putative nucleotidyltransferase with HDIG domain